MAQMMHAARLAVVLDLDEVLLLASTVTTLKQRLDWLEQSRYACLCAHGLHHYGVHRRARMHDTRCECVVPRC
jgi:hypothetical protein